MAKTHNKTLCNFAKFQKWQKSQKMQNLTKISKSQSVLWALAESTWIYWFSSRRQFWAPAEKFLALKIGAGRKSSGCGRKYHSGAANIRKSSATWTFPPGASASGPRRLGFTGFWWGRKNQGALVFDFCLAFRFRRGWNPTADQHFSWPEILRDFRPLEKIAIFSWAEMGQKCESGRFLPITPRPGIRKSAEHWESGNPSPQSYR